MNNLVFGDFLFIFLVFLIVAIPFTVAYIVYRDAKNRNMQAWLWTIVSVLVPSFIGVIIYLVVRQSYLPSDSPICSHCNTILQKDWKICPNCGADLSDSKNVIFPQRKKVSAVPFILLAIEVIVPLLVMLIFLMEANIK